MTAASNSITVRPQPVGIYPPPISFLLLPEAEDQSALPALMAGDSRVLMRAEWRFYRLALDGAFWMRRTRRSRARVGSTIWNRFVLQPSLDGYFALQREVPPEAEALLDASAFAAGLAVQPTLGGEGELRAVGLLTAASAQIELDDFAGAIKLLEDAWRARERCRPCWPRKFCISLVLSKVLPIRARQSRATKTALALAGDTPLMSLRAELWLNLGMAWQEAGQGRRDPLLEAAKAYQEAIRCGLSLEVLPELYAMAQSNLALTYLTIPARDASDQLRMGIAVQCLREALKIYKRDTHLELWSSAQLNLANSLQYLPTSHPEENLQQAVNLYEELLEVRSQAQDPLGYARLLANQANALAHLGIFKPALEKLNEAYKLFHWHGEPEMAASVLELVSDVNLKIEEANR